MCMGGGKAAHEEGRQSSRFNASSVPSRWSMDAFHCSCFCPEELPTHVSSLGRTGTHTAGIQRRQKSSVAPKPEGPNTY